MNVKFGCVPWLEQQTPSQASGKEGEDAKHHNENALALCCGGINQLLKEASVLTQIQ